jgi:transposase-like protein
LQWFTKRLQESALDGELTDHLGYYRHDPAGRDSRNSRNGHRAKAVLTDVGSVEFDVPRDRGASFEPKIVPKRQRRLAGVDEPIISSMIKIIWARRPAGGGGTPRCARRNCRNYRGGFSSSAIRRAYFCILPSSL